MTVVSEQMYGVICKYCDNCKEVEGRPKCLEDVPWWCCSIYCKYFAEEKLEPQPRKRRVSMKRLMRKTLVETF